MSELTELQKQVERDKQYRHAEVERARAIKAQPRAIKSGRGKAKPADDREAIDRSYDQLDGEWLEWLDTARAYDHTIPSQDQLDLRHDILIELAGARARDNQPIPKLRQYRIASLCRINYWRAKGKGEQAVCLYDGLAKPLHCRDCSHKPSEGQCPYRAVRPLLSLDTELEGQEGITLADTIADDKAIDLEAWQDAATWLINGKPRLIEIAYKLKAGTPLNHAERDYLYKLRKREQKRLV